MNKRFKVKVTTPERSSMVSDIFGLNTDARDDEMDSVIENTPLQMIHDAGLQIGMPRKILGTTLSILRGYWGYVLLSGIIAYLLLRPSEYNYLIEEIQHLKKKAPAEEPAPRSLKNFCTLYEGTKVVPVTALYKFGILRWRTTDPNALIDDSRECLALAGQAGVVRLEFPAPVRVCKVGIYHPATANPNSAPKCFAVEADGASARFTFENIGYSEFDFPAVTRHIKLVISSNHGEPKYTALYRFYVLGTS